MKRTPKPQPQRGFLLSPKTGLTDKKCTDFEPFRNYFKP